MTTTTPTPARAALPAPVQIAIDYGRQLPDTKVYWDDLRGIPGGDWIGVDFVLPYGEDNCIEMGTTWLPDGDGWRFDGALYRTFSRQNDLHKLGSWEEVAAFLAAPHVPDASS
ncbi:hypothetical protein [Nonomuraea rubra]|uniref:hypothetical protein n=1 Tax=Nonomuraea rubra TaxID=46180 RepID=UPI0033D6ADC6